MTSAVIVQARMGSTRFPGKVVQDLHGKAVVWHVLSRCLEIPGADTVILAIPDEAESDFIEVAVDDLPITIVRGSESDVLGRYLKAARWVQATHIVRITADCPLIDPHVCGAVLEAAKRPDIDYASNVMPRTFEKGLDCEAFTRWTLEVSARDALDPIAREHVTPYMQVNNLFTRINIESGEPERANQNLCVDWPQDLERVRFVMEMRDAAG
jgi:spore coat polysaccharide biosynthesis protein SpsF